MPDEDRTLKTFLFQFNYFPKPSAVTHGGADESSAAADGTTSSADQASGEKAVDPHRLDERRRARDRRGSAA